MSYNRTRTVREAFASLYERGLVGDKADPVKAFAAYDACVKALESAKVSERDLAAARKIRDTLQAKLSKEQLAAAAKLSQKAPVAEPAKGDKSTAKGEKPSSKSDKPTVKGDKPVPKAK